MSKYLLWDVDESNLYYTFSKEELKDVNLLEFINLHKRAGFSEYKLPLDSEVGKQITLSNRDFAFHNSGNYYGIKLFLKPEGDSENGIYWFMFKDQTATFLFNGKHWVLSQPWPNTHNIQLNWKKDLTEYGILNIIDYYKNPIKKDLFNNLNMSGLKEGLEGCFFKYGALEDLGNIKEDTFTKHNHIADPHTHNYQLNKEHGIDVLEKLDWILKLLDHKDDTDWVLNQMFLNGHWSGGFWGIELTDHPCGGWLGAWSDADGADELTLLSHGSKQSKAFNGYGNVQEEGGEETRPKNIQGSFVVQGF